MFTFFVCPMNLCSFRNKKVISSATQAFRGRESGAKCSRLRQLLHDFRVNRKSLGLYVSVFLDD